MVYIVISLRVYPSLRNIITLISVSVLPGLMPLDWIVGLSLVRLVVLVTGFERKARLGL